MLWRKIDIKNELAVDNQLSDSLDINIEVTFPRVQCRYLTLEVLDKSGIQQSNIRDTIHQHDINANGSIAASKKLSVNENIADHLKYEGTTDEEKGKQVDDVFCMSCGLAAEEGKCCNSCNDLLNAYFRKGFNENLALGELQCTGQGREDLYVSQDRGGCNIHGVIGVSRCEGLFQIVPSSNFIMKGIFHFQLQSLSALNNPLANQSFIQDPQGGVGSFNYFVKIVPTTYIPLKKQKINLFGEKLKTNKKGFTKQKLTENEIFTYQYSVTNYFAPFHFGITRIPGIHIWYDLSPIRVTLREKRGSFFHFFTSVCAIVGGVVTVGQVIDSVFFKLSTLRAKRRIGKVA
ncbi:MAG: putative Endoplasmic reticulum-Golgi intermediate compartment protein 3 [Streblomastix strix]|uniref:Putative Endoplasmic reticulum-Golgi intermediate compartment protein 3 n=1 Tax=Streblomastix strix TaxID=222440 RepID=A0A5J4VUG5_9EUKA|nr:MAG: putative Endoplasmic reticulum-Golgi intermediate compartment protein 3 [Streblomastix strix]